MVALYLHMRWPAAACVRVCICVSAVKCILPGEQGSSPERGYSRTRVRGVEKRTAPGPVRVQVSVLGASAYTPFLYFFFCLACQAH